MLAIGPPAGEELLVILMILGLPLAIIIGALLDILKSEFKVQQNKLIWVLVTILIPIIGTILYFLIGRSQKIESAASQ